MNNQNNNTFYNAYLSLLQKALVHIRHLALKKENYEKISDLSDAIHNIPEMLLKWENWDHQAQREILEEYDKKWSIDKNGNKIDFSLIETFENYIKGNSIDIKDIKNKNL